MRRISAVELSFITIILIINAIVLIFFNASIHNIGMTFLIAATGFCVGSLLYDIFMQKDKK